MEEILTGNRNKINSTILFILAMGITSGLLLIANFSLMPIIGYGAIYTGIVVLLFFMLALITAHSRYLKRPMTFIDTLVVGLPVFMIGAIISFVIIDHDFEGTVVYSYYANGYPLHVLEETGKQFIPMTLFFALIFAPLHRYIRTLKLNK